MSRRLVALALLAVASVPLAAQCTLQWQPGAGTDGPDGSVFAVLTLPNGDVVAGGDFAIADRALANDVARWDGTTWHALGTGTGTAVANVLALASMPNGDLVAAGDFTTMGGQPCNRIARWNGSAWLPIGGGTNGTISELLVLPNGDFVAAGTFNLAGGAVVDRIARWDGAAWSRVGTGLSAGIVQTIAVMPNGDLVAGGANPFGLKRLVGGIWQNVPGFDTTLPSTFRSLAVLPNGSLAVSGIFHIGSGVHRLAIATGTVTTPLAQPFASTAATLLAAANGDLLYGGDNGTGTLARWNGSTWTTWGGGVAPVAAMAIDGGGRVVVGAAIGSAAFPRPATVARFDGSLWQTLGGGAPPMVKAAVTLEDGDVVCGGAFATIGGIAAANIARWNGTTWAPLGSGVDGRVTALAVTPHGEVLVGGSFTTAGGTPAPRIARWNGSVWSPIGSGLPFDPYAVVALANGEILAGGSHQLHRWDGVGWTNVLFPFVPGTVHGMTPISGTAALVVGGFLANSPVLLYANGTLSPIAGAPSGMGWCVLPRSDGTFVVAHGASASRWDGISWTAMTPVSARGLASLPDGGAIACGSVTAFTPPSAIYRLGPSIWQPFGDLLGGEAMCVATTPRGEILVGGTFTTVGGQVSAGFTRAVPTCPGATVVVGSGCSGLAGPVALAAASLPFVGGSFRAKATGLSANSVALALAGMPSPAFPVPGAPGCFGYLDPLATELVFPVVGTATMALPIPNDPAVFGVQLRLQVAAIEFGATAVSIASTNALDLTVGTMGF